MSAAPLGADPGGAGSTGWLGVGTRSGEDRRKGLGFTANIPSYGGQTVGSVTYYFNGVSQRWQKERRCGKERRKAFDILTSSTRGEYVSTGGGTLTAPDDAWCSRCGAAGPLESIGRDSQGSWHFTHACDPYKRAENAQRWAASDDDDTADFVASILQAEIDRDLLARAQHPSHRRDEHGDGGLGVRPREGKRWQLFRRWGRALRGRVSVRGFYVAGPGLSWGSEHVTPVDARPGGSQVVGLGPEVHGEPVERVGDRSHVWPVKEAAGE